MGLKHKDLGKYIVYSDGRVFSKSAGYFLAAPKDNNGYNIVKVPHRVTLHRLVAKCFKPNSNNYPCINHKDGNKNNNHISNLEWCTHKHNIQHAFDTGLIVNTVRGSKHSWSKLTPIQVHVIKEALDNGYKGYRIAQYFKTHRATIYRIRDEISWRIVV